VVRLVSGDGTLAADEHKAAQAAGLKVRLIPGLNVTPDTASTHPPSRTQRAALPPYISRKAA